MWADEWLGGTIVQVGSDSLRRVYRSSLGQGSGIKLR